MENKTTSQLMNVLKGTKINQIDKYLSENAEYIADSEKPFTNYMRQLFKSKGKAQQSVFVAAEIPSRYGYKLISGEKHTLQRDVIIRLCIAGGFNLKETQRALELYQMPMLYPRMPRDAVLIIAINNGVNCVTDVDNLLAERGMEILSVCGEEE